MANTIPFNTMVAKTALPILKAKLPMAMNANKDYQKDITDENARVNGIINIKKPPRYVGRDGELMKVESTIMSTLPMQLQMAGVDVSFSAKDLQLSMDEIARGGLDTALAPAMDVIAAKIEKAGTALYSTVPNVVGTPGSGTATVASINLGGAYIQSLGGMSTGRYGVIDPFVSAGLAGSVNQFFNPTGDISKAYKSGMIGDLAGFSMYEGNAVKTHTAGTYGGTPAVNGAGQTGSTLVTDGWTVTTTTLNVGDTFTIAGVNSVNPTTREDTGKLQNFTVTTKTVTDGSGNSTISIFPAITPDGAFQTVSASPADNALMTVTSGASTATSRQSLLYDPRAFTFASAVQAKPAGNNFQYGKAVDEESGIGISYITQYDAKTNQVMHRMDVLYAWAATYPELAVRLQS